MTEGLGDKIVSVLEFFQGRDFFTIHDDDGLRVNAVAGNRNQLQSLLDMFGEDGIGAGQSGGKPGSTGQKAQLTRHATAGTGE